MTFSVVIAVLVRLSLVLLFFPFSAIDKTAGFHGALQQAKQAFSNDLLARAMLFTGLFVEVVMSLGVLTGIADRFAAFVLAGYCAATAVLFKQFWAHGAFWRHGGRDMELFWDFLKNFSVAGGFLLITFSPTASGVPAFLTAPLSSTHPYAQVFHG